MTEIRYNQLPNRFLRNQDPGFRRWFRGEARRGRAYYNPALTTATHALRTFEPNESIPEGWQRVTLSQRARD